MKKTVAAELDRKLDIRYFPIRNVIPWKKNPRYINKVDYERLKKQIIELKVYKPLVGFIERGKAVVLGGNMRLRALNELGATLVAVSVIKPKDEAEKIKYNVSDNDRAGAYNEGELAELILPHAEKIALDTYQIDLGSPVSLKAVVEGAGPDLPSPGEKKEPELPSAVFIEIYCSKKDLEVFKKTLEEWAERDGVTVNIS